MQHETQKKYFKKNILKKYLKNVQKIFKILLFDQVHIESARKNRIWKEDQRTNWAKVGKDDQQLLVFNNLEKKMGK